MALLELIGRLGLNTSGFQLGLKQAESAAHGSSHKISHLFAHAGRAFLGLHEGARAIHGLINETIRWGQNIEETKKEFEEIGLTIDDNILKKLHEASNSLLRVKDTLALYIAPIVGFLGKTFEMALSTIERFFRFIGGFSAGGLKGAKAALADYDKELTKRAIADTNDPKAKEKEAESAKKLNEAKLKTFEIEEKNRMAGMSAEEKIAALLEKQVALRQLLATLPGRLETAAQREELKQAILQNEGEVADLRRKAVRGPDGNSLILGTSIGQTRDPLAAIGAFSGFREYSEQQLSELRIIAKNTEGLRLNL